MDNFERWVIIGEDGNGKISIFYKTTLPGDQYTLNEAIKDIKTFDVTILAVFQEKDIIRLCQL